MSQPDRSIRPDIQALRAIAVAAVIAFHLWPGIVTGGYVGVDVFFVISGFLITAHLLREINTTGSISLLAFWGRRIRRLLPAAFLVLIATGIGILAFVPITEWPRNFQQIAASAVYGLNWYLAWQATDYFGSEELPSAVQHYWSLSVEEQFYLVWPLLLLGAFMLRRNTRDIAVTMGLVFVISLAWSIYETIVDQAWAYFSTLTHAWEFALGGLLAFAPVISMKPATILAARLVGFGAIAVTSFLYSGTTLFPGYTALVPTLGAALVIYVGAASSSDAIVKLQPIQWLGDVSYAAYLWHWPLIIIAPYAIENPNTLILLAATLVLAWLTKIFVEDPIRLRPLKLRWTYASAAVVSAVVVAGSAISANSGIYDADDVASLIANGTRPCYGAMAAVNASKCPDSHLLNLDIIKKRAVLKDMPKTPRTLGKLAIVEHGNPKAKTLIALVGDSHARQYLPALLLLAKKNDWRIWDVYRGSCSPSAVTWKSPYGGDETPACKAFRQQIQANLAKRKDIDVIITSSVSQRLAWKADAATLDAAADGFRKMWATWKTGGQSVLVIPDNPGPPEGYGEISDCVLKNRTKNDPCSFPREQVVERDVMVDAARIDNVPLMDFTDIFCDTVCHGVVGGLGTGRGGWHVDGLFAQSLAPIMEPIILSAIKARPKPATN